MISRRPGARLNRGRIAVGAPAPGGAPPPDTLLSLVTDASGYLFDALDPSGLTLTGSTVDAFNELVTGTPFLDVGTPAVYGETSLNGGPGVTFDGANDRAYIGNAIAALNAIGSDNNPFTVIVYGSFAAVDPAAAGSMCGWGSASATVSKWFGQTPSGAGGLLFRTRNGGTLSTNGDPPPDTAGHIYRLERDGTSMRLFTDGVAHSGNPYAHADPGAMTADRFGIGCDPDSGGEISRLIGVLGQIVVIPGAPNTATNEAIEALMAGG